MLQLSDNNYAELYDTYFRTIQEMVSVSNDTVANQLSSINILLVIVSIVLTLVGAGVSIYISYINNKLNRIKKSVEDKRSEVEMWAEKVEKTEMMIKTDLSGLYQQLRSEETKSLLQRLCEEPRDIANITELLLARDISNELFGLLKDAYSSLLEDNTADIDSADYEYMYHLLFFQHFSEESFKDNFLRPKIILTLNRVVDSAFKNDIIKSTLGLCQAINDESISLDREELLEAYLKAVNSSKYRCSVEVKEILQNHLSHCGMLTEAIDACRRNGEYLEMFGIEKPAINMLDETKGKGLPEL